MNQTPASLQMSGFAELFEKNFNNLDLKPGAIFSARVLTVTDDYVLVDAGFKSEARIPLNEFKDDKGSVDVKVGDSVAVAFEALESGSGETKLSREKARRLESFYKLAKLSGTQEIVSGIVTERVRGGFIVVIDKLRTFLPGSLLDTKPVKDLDSFIGKEVQVRVVKVDEKTHNIVVSRRAALYTVSSADRAALLDSLHDGMVTTGTVKNITDYGAFVDLGGIDGLLHITDMSWKRIKHPSEVVKVGDELKVKVLRFDKEKQRVSLGLKQLSEDPWQDITRRYPPKTRLFGKITNVADYGFFVEIEPGVEGLVHLSEIDWTNRNVVPSKVVSVGQEVEVMVLEVDPEKRRISLGMKQCTPNPWEEFASTHNKGETITGKVKSVTEFGVFIGLTGNIDGLVHMSDISWTESGEKLLSNFQKGQEIEAIILNIDVPRERISLGIKQLEKDIYVDYFEQHPKDAVVSGIVSEVHPKFALVDLGNGITGKIKVADASRVAVKDISHILAVGDEIEAKVMGLDKKSRQVTLSIKELQPEMGSENAPANTQLGDLLKAQMEEDNEDEEGEGEEEETT